MYNIQSTLDKSKFKGPAFNFDSSRDLKYQDFELSSLMLKKFKLLSFIKKKNQKSSKNLAKKGENALKKL